MMTCRACRDQLSAYREGELADPLRKELESHLAGCAECRVELARLDQMIQQLKGLPPVRVPADFRSRIWQRIDRESWPARLRRAILEPWYLKLPVEALATAAVVLLVVQVVRVTGPEKMAMVPPLQEVEEAKQDLSQMEAREKVMPGAIDGMQEAPPVLAAGVAMPKAFRKQEAELEPVTPAELQEEARSVMADSAASISQQRKASKSLIVGPLISFRLYVPDPASAQGSVRTLVVGELKGDFLETEIPNTLFFRISADRLDDLRDGLFELGSFEQVSEPKLREGSVSVSLHILPERDS